MNFKRLAVVILAGSMAVADLVAGGTQGSGKPQAVIIVEASYSGASALVVADSVGTPIEQQVNGVANSVQMASRCGNDGKYVLAITFKPGTDLGKAQELVQNRVTLALPALPALVNRGGVTVRTKLPVRMLVSLTSPKGRHDALFLSNYAAIQIKDELARLPGVGDVVAFGQREYSMRVWLDPDKLAARKLSPRDVIDAIQKQNVQIAGGFLGKPSIDSKEMLEVVGRLSEPKEFEEIVVKVDAKGGAIKVKDVGRVEMGPAAWDSHVSIQGTQGVVLGVHPTVSAKSAELSRAVADKIKMLRARAPEGLELNVAFDFTANLESPADAKTDEFLLVDLDFPDGTSLQRKQDALARCEKLLAKVPGIQDTMALTENPFDFITSQPCVLARLTPRGQRKATREEIMRAVRKAVEEIPDAASRLRDLSRIGGFSRGGYPIELAVSGPEADKVLDLAQKLAERMKKSAKLSDVWVNQESTPRPNLYVHLDRDKAAALGISAADILDTLQAHFTSIYVNDFNRFGRTWPVVIRVDAKGVKGGKDFDTVKLRTVKGELVPLSSIASMKSTAEPAVIHRLDMKPSVQITANSFAGTSPEDACKLCESQFEQLRKELRLAAEYRLTRLAAPK